MAEVLAGLQPADLRAVANLALKVLASTVHTKSPWQKPYRNFGCSSMASFQGICAQASWEAEELREANMALESQLGQAQGRAETLQEAHTELQHQLLAARKQVGKLEGFAEECKAIPGLKKDLAAAQQRGSRLQAEQDDIQVCGAAEVPASLLQPCVVCSSVSFDVSCSLSMH